MTSYPYVRFLSHFQPPEVKFIKKESGGIGYQETVKQTKGVNAEVARLVCKEYRISCAEIILREDITVDQVRSFPYGSFLFSFVLRRETKAYTSFHN